MRRGWILKQVGREWGVGGENREESRLHWPNAVRIVVPNGAVGWCYEQSRRRRRWGSCSRLTTLTQHQLVSTTPPLNKFSCYARRHRACDENLQTLVMPPHSGN